MKAKMGIEWGKNKIWGRGKKKKKKVIKKNNFNAIFQNSNIMPKIVSKSLLVVFHFVSGSYMTQYGSDGKYEKSRKPEGKWLYIIMALNIRVMGL